MAGSFVVQKTAGWNPATVATTLTNASFSDPISGALNQPSTFSFQMGEYDAQAADIVEFYTLITLLYEGVSKKFRGPVISIEKDPDTSIVTYHCADPSVMFDYRFIDRGAGRIDYLGSGTTGGIGQFDQGSDGDPAFGWTDVGDAVSEIDTAQVVKGGGSLLINLPAPTDNPSYTKATVTITPTSQGDLMTVAGWFKIDPGSYVEPNSTGYGLIVRQLDPITGDPVATDQAFRGYENVIDGDTPKDTWQRIETTTWLAGGPDKQLEIELYPVVGNIRWDAVTVTKMESLSQPDQDQAAIARLIILFIQNLWADLGDVGKSNLFITLPVTKVVTGVIRSRTYQFADHISAATALAEFASLNDGFDYDVDVDGQFNIYPPQLDIDSNPIGIRQGVDRRLEIVLTSDVDDPSGDNGIIRRSTQDGSQGANQVVQLGVGDGPDREEGAADDSTAFGGVTVQKIIPPLGDPPIDALRETARQELLVSRDPTYYEFTVINSDWTNTIGLGDAVGSAFNVGRVQEIRDLRVVTTSRDPVTDTLTVGLTPLSTTTLHDVGAGGEVTPPPTPRPPPVAPPPGDPGTPSAMWYAFEYSSDPANVARVEAGLGHTAAGVLIHGIRGSLADLFTNGYVIYPWAGSGRQVSFTACCMPNTGDAAANYAALLAGDYDAALHDMFAKLAAAFPFAIVRVLHEPNLSYIGEWGVIDSGGTIIVDAATYKTAWSYIVVIARSHSTNFRFDYCFLAGGAIAQEDYCPDDADFDIASLDVYGRAEWGATSADRFSHLQSMSPGGLDDLATLVAAHTKDTSFPEMSGATIYAFPNGAVTTGDDADLETLILDYATTIGAVYVGIYMDGPPADPNTDLLTTFPLTTAAVIAWIES